jgi:hypothetical protein
MILNLLQASLLSENMGGNEREYAYVTYTEFLLHTFTIYIL